VRGSRAPPRPDPLVFAPRPGEHLVSDHSFDLSDPAIGALIRRKAAKLARQAATPTADRDDFAQDLWVALLSRWKKYNPRRGNPDSFVHVVLKHAAANIVRKHRAAKRIQPGRSVAPEGCPDSRLADWEMLLDLILDVGEAIKPLPDCLSKAAAIVANSDTIAEAARDLGVSRSTLYSRLDSIRKRFENRELQKYLQNLPDTSRSNRVIT